MRFLFLLSAFALVASAASSQSSERLTGTSTEISKPTAVTNFGGGGIVADGSFEGGSPNAAWTEASTGFGTPLCTVSACGTGTGTGPHSGEWWTWFGGSSTGDTGSMEQSVTIPSAASATLKFWLELPNATGGTGYVAAHIDGQEVFRATYADDQATYATYALVEVDVTGFADDGVHVLLFESVTTGAGNLFVDDVSLEVPIVGPSLLLSTTAIDFGNVNTGNSPTETITLTNQGTEELTFTNIIFDPGTSTGFSVDFTGTAMSLAPAAFTTMAITFAPTEGGVSDGAFSIISNAPGSPAAITVVGTGVAAFEGETYPSTDTPIAIVDNDPTGIVSTLVVPSSVAGTIADLDVDLNMSHTWIGDLIVTVAKDAASSVLLNRPGAGETGVGCSGDNPVIIVNDEGTDGSTEDSCVAGTNPGYPVPGGSYTPFSPLSVFDNTPVAGTYTLAVTDNAGGDTGNLESWALLVTNTATATEEGPNGISALTVAPNPLAGSGQVNLTVAKTQDVHVAVYDMMGREVMTLLNRTIAAGQAAYIGFQTSDLPAGVYMIRAIGTDISLTERVTVVR